MTVLKQLHMDISTALRGAGGGGGSQRQPIESPDSLRSIAYARIVDLVGEGEIVGFADQENPLSCVFLNETPVANADGSLNFRNIQIDSRVGTQAQDPLPNFDGVENEIGIGVELRQGTAWVRSISNLNLDSLRVRLSTPNMTKSNTENGDIGGSSVKYKIELQTDGGTFALKFDGTMSGKTTTKYERSHRIELPKANTGWVLRITRVTPNSTSATEQNATYIESYTEIVEAKLRMPMSALVSVIVDAEQFNSIPARAYRMKGRIIRVPSNYDPDTRIYTGVWDGTFQSRYSNNPAWVFYDMALNQRYGLGHLIGQDQIDKWTLYRIGQYCDGMVDDGKGGLEPRFTCNLVLTQQADAHRVMQDLATVFRGIIYASGGAVTAVGDMPEDAVYTYTAANVVDGKFFYAGSDRKLRHTVALVSYSDINDFGRAKVEYVDDEAGIARYGVQPTEIVAVGCNSRGQARRWGRYLLATERYETESVSFNVGLDGTIVAPGKVINIADPLKQGVRRGGRIKSASLNGIQVDFMPGSVAVGDKLAITLPSGIAEMRNISALNGDIVTVSPAFSAVPVTQSVWAVESTDIPLQKFRVLGVAEATGEGLGFSISAVQHENGKFAYADSGILIDSSPIPDVPKGAVPAPTGLVVTHRDVADQNTAVKIVNLSWDAVPVASSYNVLWRQSNGSWVDLGTTGFTNIDISGIRPGGFEVQVVAINSLGQRSTPTFGGPYDVPAVGTAPGFVDDLRSETAQEIINRFNADAAVAQQAADDATAKANAARDAALAAVDALAAEVGEIVNAPDWDPAEQYMAGWIVKYQGRLKRARVDTIGQQPDLFPAVWEDLGAYSSVAEVAAAALTMSTTNASDIDAEAARTDALYARMPAGSGQLATTALVATETAARVAEDSALGSRTQAIEVRMPAGAGALASQATVAAVESASVGRDNALGSRVGVVEARMPAGSGALATSASVTSVEQASIDRDNTIAQSVQSVQASSRPNPNFVSNPSFEQGAPPWTLAAGGIAREAAYGSYHYMAATPGTGAASSQTIGGLTVPLVYTLSADIFCSSNVGTKRIDITAYAAGGGYIGAVTAIADNTKLGVWQRVSVSIAAPANTSYFVIRSIVEGTNDNTSFRRFKLEVGAVATAYSDELTTYSTVTATTSLRADLTAQGVATATAITDVKAQQTGGGNLLTSTDFAGSTPAANKMGLIYGYGNSATNIYVAGNEDGGVPTGAKAIIAVGNSNVAGAVTMIGQTAVADYVLVEPGKTYIASCWASGNVPFTVGFIFTDAAGNNLGELSSAPTSAGGGTSFSDSVRAFRVQVAPPNARYARIRLVALSQGAGQSYYVRWVRPMIEQAAPGQTQPSPWSPGAAGLNQVTQTLTAGLAAKYGLYLQSGNLISGFESSNNGIVADFNILATIFRITSPAGGARTEFSNGNWRVYDGSGLLRVAMGINI